MKRGETCRGAGDHESWWSCRIRRGPAVQCEIARGVHRVVPPRAVHDAVDPDVEVAWLDIEPAEVVASTLYAAEPGANFAWYDVAGIAREDGWTFEPATKTWTPPAE